MIVLITNLITLFFSTGPKLRSGDIFVGLDQSANPNHVVVTSFLRRRYGIVETVISMAQIFLRRRYGIVETLIPMARIFFHGGILVKQNPNHVVVTSL